MSMMADFQQLMQPVEDAPISPVVRQGVRVPLADGSSINLSMALQQAHRALIDDLIARIHAQLPEFFEYLVIDVLLAMGYGGRRRDMAQRLGRTGDGGIDGLIAQDELGLDLIYIQAKRLKPGSVVPVSEVRDFVGSLDARHAVKGVFVTTSHFSPAAIEFCGQVSRRVVLVDGARLAELMVRHNIGVKVKESYQLKRIDADYFAVSPAVRMQEMISASNQPRR
jgi:restriction system protein